MWKATLLLLALLAASAISARAGDAKTLNTSCESAITKSEVIAAHRKWWPERPDPKAAALNIRTHANFAKQNVPALTVPIVGGIVGGIWSHEKVGEMMFQEQSGSCLVISNGHPADVMLSDLAKAFEEHRSTVAENSKDKKLMKVAQDCVDDPHSLLDCHGHYKQ